MPKAHWENSLLAESDHCVVVEGNQYFPQEAVKQEFLRPSEHHTFCSWKGTCSYYDVVVDGKINANAAWYYPDPMPKAMNIKDHIAFWKGVTIES